MPKNLLDLSGRVAIITGGGTGMGAATAQLFAEHGADVVIAGRTAETLEHTAAAVRDSTGRRCVPMPTDVKNEEQVIRLVQQTVSELGRIDILVNSAGGSRMIPLKDLPTKAWEASFGLNVRAPYFTTREAGQHMIAQRSGAIVNISSNAGLTGVKGGSHYAAAKSGLQMFTAITAAEWGRYGIRANCVAAGLIATENAKRGWAMAKLDVSRSASAMPLGRAGTPQEIANTILFLVSDASSYITGQTIAVNGGPMMSGIADT